MASYFKKIKTIIGKINKRGIYRFFIIIGVIFLGFLAAISSYYLSYSGKIYPNISAGNINIGGNDYNGAVLLLSEKVVAPKKIELNYQDKKFYIDTSDIDFSLNIPASVNSVYNLTRTGNFLNDLKVRISLLYEKRSLPLTISINDENLNKAILKISQQINVQPIEPSISINGSEISVNKGLAGSLLDQEALVSEIKKSLSWNTSGAIEIPVKVSGLTLTTEEENAYKSRAFRLIDKNLDINFEYSKFSFGGEEMIQLIDPRSGYKDADLSTFIDKIAASVERSPQNSKFTFKDGKVTEFQASLDGIKVDNEKFKEDLIKTLNFLSNSDKDSASVDVPVIKTPAEITINEVNDFGIEELIGRGSSTFYHSIASRVHNVALAASRLNGTLVKPGETFSFNQALGDVSAATGYQQAYIINQGRTILGDGGGVCQVSTTLFRAILNAGFPITERQAHAYRVSYYEQDSPPGLDATVYSPSPDLKFTNDSPGYVLIVAKVDTKNYSLVFELYGKSDGRVSSISKPVVTNVSAPPADLYQDDPTLPTGTIKQIDWKAWGAKVTFNYSVKRNGETIYSKTFISNYKPWQAIFLRGTGPAV